MSTEKTLGSEIRRLRLKAEITLRSFAKEVGHTAAHQSDIEHGRRMPSKEVLEKITARLAHVGATPEAFEHLDFRLSDELEAWVQAEPEARALLREARASGRPAGEILEQLRAFLRNPRQGGS